MDSLLVLSRRDFLQRQVRQVRQTGLAASPARNWRAELAGGTDTAQAQPVSGGGLRPRIVGEREPLLKAGRTRLSNSDRATRTGRLKAKLSA